MPLIGELNFVWVLVKYFPQGVLVAVTQVGSEAGDGGGRACVSYEVAHPLCSVTVTTLSRSDSDYRLQCPDC